MKVKVIEVVIVVLEWLGSTESITDDSWFALPWTVPLA